MKNLIKAMFLCMLFLFTGVGCERNKTSYEFQIYNDTKQTISFCSLKEDYSHGRVMHIKNIKPGEMKSCVFRDCYAECGVIISLTFANGEKVSYPPLGYLTFSWSRKYFVHINTDRSIAFAIKGNEKVANILPKTATQQKENK